MHTNTEMRRRPQTHRRIGSHTDIPLPSHKLGLTSWGMCDGDRWLERDIPLPRGSEISHRKLECELGHTRWGREEEGEQQAQLCSPINGTCSNLYYIDFFFSATVNKGIHNSTFAIFCKERQSIWDYFKFKTMKIPKSKNTPQTKTPSEYSLHYL